MSSNPQPPNRSSPSARNPDPDHAPLAIAREWAPGFVLRLLKDLPGIHDPRMRALALAERLAPLDIDDIIAVVGRLHEALKRGDARALEVISCFRDAAALEKKLGRVRMHLLAIKARQAGASIASLLVVPLDPPTGGTRTHRDLRELSLGERKALAKGSRKELLIKLLEDDHPHVQEYLLANPRLTSREVVTAAAKASALPHMLRGISRHARWMHNYEVRKALAKNPQTPLDVSGRIVITLQRTDLEEIIGDERLHEHLRNVARARIETITAAVSVSSGGT